MKEGVSRNRSNSRSRLSHDEGFLVLVLSFVLWITGIMVALAVGFGMISGVLAVPGFLLISKIVGWIVVILTILGVILMIIGKLSR